MGERRADLAGPSPQLPGRRDAAGRGGREEASAPRAPSRAALARARPAPARSDSARAAPASRARERGAGARAVSLPGRPLRHAPRGRAPSRRRDSRCGSARGRSPQGARAGHPGHCSPRLSALWLELCSGRAAPEDGVKLQRSKRSLRGWEVACATRAARSRSRRWGALARTARDPRRTPRWPRGRRARAAEGGARFGGGAAVIACWAE